MVPRFLGLFHALWLRLARKRNVGVGWHGSRILRSLLAPCWPTLARVV